MSNPPGQDPVQSPGSTNAASPDVENQAPAMGFGVSSILRRWRREDLLKKGRLTLRGLALLLSLLAFIIVASNKHGPGRSFDEYEEYRYLLAITIISTLYTGLQAFRYVHQIRNGNELFPQRTMALLDFSGDQIMAYLLISASSAAIPMTDRIREGADNIFTDSSAAAITMAFFAFLSLALSSVISGYKLSTQSFI